MSHAARTSTVESNCKLLELLMNLDINQLINYQLHFPGEKESNKVSKKWKRELKNPGEIF